MTITIDRIEKELDIPKEQLIREGIRHYLEFEVRKLNAEITKICAAHGVRSFDELWDKLERGEISESECFDDLTKLEYLELKVETIRNLLKEFAGP
jgi:hypothetical protein